MKNISGTLLPTFKFRPSGGIELISAAVRDERTSEILSKFRVRDSKGIHDVAYYDSVITNDVLKSVRYSGGRVILEIVVGTDDKGNIVTETFSIPKTINSNNISIQAGTKGLKNEVAIYGEGGESIQGSGSTISDDIDDSSESGSEAIKDQELKHQIPTSNAVCNYIGYITTGGGKRVGLESRLNGKDVHISYGK